MCAILYKSGGSAAEGHERPLKKRIIFERKTINNKACALFLNNTLIVIPRNEMDKIYGMVRSRVVKKPLLSGKENHFGIITIMNNQKDEAKGALEKAMQLKPDEKIIKEIYDAFFNK